MSDDRKAAIDGVGWLSAAAEFSSFVKNAEDIPHHTNAVIHYVEQLESELKSLRRETTEKTITINCLESELKYLRAEREVLLKRLEREGNGE